MVWPVYCVELRVQVGILVGYPVRLFCCEAVLCVISGFHVQRRSLFSIRLLLAKHIMKPDLCSALAL